MTKLSVLLGVMFTLTCWEHPTFSQNQKNPQLPNIILILADDMGYGDISGLNPDSRIKTPHLDQLIQSGVSFSNAHSSASVCTPSRYGLLTGRYAFRTKPAANGIGGFDKPVIEPSRETLASLLKQSGYATAVVGKWHLGLDWQTQDGLPAKLNPSTGFSNVDYSKPVLVGPNSFVFDYSFIHPASLDIPPYVFIENHRIVDPDVVLTTSVYPARLGNTQYAWDKKHTDSLAVYWEKGVWWRQGEMSHSFRVEDCQSTLFEKGMDFIQQHADRNSEQPFFLYLPLTGPHTPWMPSRQFEGKSGAGRYGDFVLEVDHLVGQLKDVLSKNQLDENTLLIFSSDNGAYWPEEEIQLHTHDSNVGTRGQKGDVWDGGHRIPLLLSWPGTIAGYRQFPHLVSLTDLFDTISELVGNEPAVQISNDSESFLAVLEGESDSPARTHMVHHSSGNFYAIRTQDWKLIDGLGSGGFTAPTRIQPEQNGPSGQLYHLSTDPEEKENLFLSRPEKVAELRELMKKIREGD